ncbi:MAG TPA: DUF2281 domain-containing protein [Marinobacter sp.]|jgi:hypothetical protein|uniref:DUF2281 domain-containing protein n=1 Tax=Marinobacter sp. TaxID=50741 RepID=UPI000EB96A93|nr:DUF2281 domain-containing protein [Marinobacter sp.]MBC7193003.1 DUF2281 domain-containing protein [Marinobacter sp.]HCW89823.1 DUF2281 domain-containing protein [Marinobacter sp.]
MQLDELISMVSRLPPARQQEVIDFAAFLEQRYGDNSKTNQAEWTGKDFKTMSVEQAMRGIEDEPELYSDSDIRER